jgi:Polymerase beta, Nucleotidyltransferase
MKESPEAVTSAAVGILRQAGARFAYLHGSRATGQHRPDSDIDIAAYFGGQAPNSFDILLPPGVDLLVLDDAPLGSLPQPSRQGLGRPWLTRTGSCRPNLEMADLAPAAAFLREVLGFEVEVDEPDMGLMLSVTAVIASRRAGR